jgi:hypothetical protein
MCLSAGGVRGGKAKVSRIEGIEGLQRAELLLLKLGEVECAAAVRRRIDELTDELRAEAGAQETPTPARSAPLYLIAPDLA